MKTLFQAWKVNLYITVYGIWDTTYSDIFSGEGEISERSRHDY